jgi:NAD(P)-dependent dehydrogenase (short-subunit alcohol dehydrogenase family)
MNTNDLNGKVALVTGAARGIGYAIAELLGQHGVKVGVNDLRASDVVTAAAKLTKAGIQAIPVPGDVTSAVSATGLIEQIEIQFGHLDILVNNAGVLRPTRAEAIPDEEWDLVIDGNLKSTFLCCRSAIPAFRRAGGGSIVNMSSSAGKSVSTIGGVHYTAAKAGVLGLTRHLARELAADKIRVNAVCPGLIATEMVTSTIAPSAIENYAASFPAKRLGSPREVAELVVFLASERASYVTGASCDVNGGDLTI